MLYRGEPACPSCWQPNPIQSAARKGVTLCRCCQTSFKWHVRKTAPLGETIHAVPLTPAERLAQLKERCDPDCKGWAIFNEDTDPVLQICDECWFGHPEPLTDEDLLKIPAAFEALCKHRRPQHWATPAAQDLDDSVTDLVRLHHAGTPEDHARGLLHARETLSRLRAELKQLGASIDDQIQALCEQSDCEFRDFFE